MSNLWTRDPPSPATNWFSMPTTSPGVLLSLAAPYHRPCHVESIPALVCWGGRKAQGTERTQGGVHFGLSAEGDQRGSTH